MSLGDFGGLLGGLLGAFLGSFFGPLGASIGFALGSTTGGMLGAKRIEGPQLSDLKLQVASYGQFIPIIYGTFRAAGNVIWQTDLAKHTHTEGENIFGKGGTDVNSYTASFQVLICEGPIIGIRSIWADSRLIWQDGQRADSETPLPFVLYLGTDDQEPDPTIEADKGVGNVPAHLGYAYVVFTDLDLTEFGDRIPNLTFEVQASGSFALNVFARWPVDYDFPIDGSVYSYPYDLSGAERTGDDEITMHRYRSGEDYGGTFPSNPPLDPTDPVTGGGGSNDPYGGPDPGTTPTTGDEGGGVGSGDPGGGAGGGGDGSNLEGDPRGGFPTPDAPDNSDPGGDGSNFNDSEPVGVATVSDTVDVTDSAPPAVSDDQGSPPSASPDEGAPGTGEGDGGPGGGGAGGDSGGDGDGD